MMNWAAVLLAAGAGSRMGHRPKSLLLLDGEPLICRHVQHLEQAGAAMLMYLPTKSELTRAMKSSALKSMSSLRPLSLAAR